MKILLFGLLTIGSMSAFADSQKESYIAQDAFKLEFSEIEQIRKQHFKILGNSFVGGTEKVAEHCEGVLVGKRALLTTAYCVITFDKKLVSVTNGHEQANVLATFFKSDYFKGHSADSAARIATDLGLIILDKDLKTEPAQIKVTPTISYRKKKLATLVTGRAQNFYSFNVNGTGGYPGYLHSELSASDLVNGAPLFERGENNKMTVFGFLSAARYPSVYFKGLLSDDVEFVRNKIEEYQNQ
ncbi:MAG: hypothetical protein ACOYL6_14360 [Bacteriovoracaceae bacterium]